MKGLKAVLWKDFRLFCKGAGLVSLVLPLVLLCLLRLGMGDSLRQAYVRPFPIAVRDEDRTLMSRALVSQVEQVDLFSRVEDAGERSDRELLESGCAAVLTIPKDFFYSMYTMDNGLVEVTLNRDMPLEASLLRSVFVSVMDIISADQATSRAVFQFCYGELSAAETAQLWEESSQQIILDALGRQQVFDRVQEIADTRDDLALRLFACALSLICLFFPLAAVRTLPQELASGVLPRYLAAGGRAWAFFLSKFLCGALMALPSLGLILTLFPQEGPRLTLLAALGLYLFGFSLLLCLSAWARDAADAQRWGNLLLLLSLVLGGVLYPARLLPEWTLWVNWLTLPHWTLRTLGLIQTGATPVRLLAALWPVWAMSAALLILALPGLRRIRGSHTPLPEPDVSVPAPAPVKSKGFPLLPLTLQKGKAMSGGAAGLICLLLIAALCGSLASSALRETPHSLRLGVVLSQEDPHAIQLLEQLEAREGLEVVRIDLATGNSLLSSGNLEGLLTVEEGYGAALEGSGSLPLRYQSAPGASSGQAVREIIAGLATVQRSRLRGLRDAESRLGRPLTSEEQDALLADMTHQEASLGPLYAIQGLQGSGSPDAPFTPGQLSFVLLAVILTALTWAAWTGTPDARRVESRLASLRGGRVLSYGSDVLALFLISLTAGAWALLPGGGELRAWAVLPSYALCVTGITLALARLGVAERMDSLAPFAALLTCLAGGCFGSLGELSPALAALSLCTPQGLALRFVSGAGWPLAVLTVAGLGFLLLGTPNRHHH